VSGTLVPLLAGVLADSFAARRLGLLFTWSEPDRELQFHALRLEALDFVFLAAAVLGAYALTQLARVRSAVRDHRTGTRRMASAAAVP
jgi:hypothetical protein